MNIIKPYVLLEDNIDGEKILQKIEKIGRVCYKSEENINEGTAKKFVQNIIERGHESVIEHESISVRVICDRGVSHEIVRHRIASYSQESTRYCNYISNKLTFIEPCFWNKDSIEYKNWLMIMEQIEKTYIKLIESGIKPQEARSILPNSIKTEIVISMNLREWRHFLKLRTSNSAHPQMREISNMILDIFKQNIPILYDDINN